MRAEDDTGLAIRLDKTTRALSTIDYAHHEAHEGDGYFAIYSAVKNDTATIEVYVLTPNTTKWAHMLIAVECSLAGTAQLWEGTTKTYVSGNQIVPFDRNRNSAKTSGLTICHTPDGSETGTASMTQYVGATASGGRVAVGGATGSEREEFILKQNTAYLIRGTSRADGNAISIALSWYEHTNL